MNSMEKSSSKKVRVRLHRGLYHLRAEVEIPYGSQLPDNLHELCAITWLTRMEKFTGIIVEEFRFGYRRVGQARAITGYPMSMKIR